MVQQPHQTQGLNNSTTTLAMPAIISNTSQNSQENSPNSASVYQQQIIKQQQQQFLQQQQLARLNGFSAQANHLQAQYPTSQQDSPSSQTQIDTLYRTQTSRSGQNYAQKATYMTNGQLQQQQQPVYQSRQSYYQPQPQPQIQTQAQQQQQHSPATLARSMQMGLAPAIQTGSSMVGLTVRQIPAIHPNGYSAPEMSPVQSLNQTQPTHHQMQQLIMGYQQQQQMQHQLEPSELVQPINSQQYIHPGDQEQLVQQHVDIRWSQIDQNHSATVAQFASQPHQFQQPLQAQHQHPHMVTNSVQTMERVNRAFSDRDSISTVSRLNQSFAVRSQYTSAHNSNKLSQKFGFVSLTSEALKRIIGLSSDSSRRPLLNSSLSEHRADNMQRNLNLTVETVPKPKNVHGFGSNQLTSSGAKITVIDSGDDYCFKKQVFLYQLVILRLINLICALLVLLSPVAMLLIPKMEFMFRRGDEADNSMVTTSPSIDSPSSVTNGVGLAISGKPIHPNVGNQQTYLVPQPQWRISECTSDCDGPLIGFVARFIMLCIAYWALFFRSRTATLPRIDFHRCALVSLAVLLTITYWLFFFFRVFDKRYNDFELQYMTIVQFASSMLESLILLHYLAVVMLELRRQKKIYCLKVVRSPDGASRYYSCGTLSVQQCAQFVLEKYHCQFNSYGPYREHLLQLESQIAKQSVGSDLSKSHGADQRSREKASSPTPSNHRADTMGGRSSRRHHSSRHHRSPSGSPTRSTSYRSRSQRRIIDANGGSQSKIYEVDMSPPRPEASPGKTQEQNGAGESSNQQVDQQQKQQNRPENDSNSGDQSSDATNRMKESSLDTVRLAGGDNSTNTGNNNSETTSATTNGLRHRSRPNDSEGRQTNRHSSARDETESVRSGRSRRSTSRSHHRHYSHSHHRDRSSSRAAHEASTMQPDASNASDLLADHERKLKRRKFRLLAAVQNTFDRMKQIDEANPPESHEPNPQTLGAEQAARSLYPSIARSLQKYLRLTRQTGRHNLQSIYEHLSKCLLYKLTARTFLEKFTCQDPVWQQSETNLFAECRLADSMAISPHRKSNGLEINSWSLVCDTLLSRQITGGTFFVLRQGQVQLLVSVAKAPHLSLTEELIDERSARFVFGPNSETSV